MIEVTNLTVKYKDFTAVDSISFEVKKGEIFGIIDDFSGLEDNITLSVKVSSMWLSRGLRAKHAIQ